MKQRTSVRRIELCQRLYDDDGNELITVDKIKEVLEEHKSAIKDYAYIIHDKCTKKIITDDGTETTEPISPHIHLGLRFKDNKPQHLEDISQWFGVAENYLEKIKGSWSNYLLYLIHANAPDKYQYNPVEVIANFDFEAEIEKAQNSFNITNILQKIMDGDIRDISEIDGLTYIFNSREINEAFKYRHQLLAKSVERDIEVIMITGTSGSGKTTLAKRIAKSRNLDIFVSSNSNDPFYGYSLQRAILLDDLRPSCLSLTDLLKIIDNHTNSTVRARYHNKTLDCELIIITTVLPIDSFFRQVFENEQEPVIQFKRRVGTYIKMTKSTISVQRWNDIEMKYSAPIVYLNDTLVEFEAEKIANSTTPKEEIETLLPFLSGKEITNTENLIKNRNP